MKDLIREMKTKGKTIIFSTHQMEQAERLCDEICLINKGRVVLYGGLGQIKRKYGDGTIHMEFEGESSNLKSLGGIAGMDLYENYAEVRIRDGVSRHEFLKQVVSLVDVTKFSVEEASLNSIFINAVNADKTGGENVA
jgi:ABC-2 type transport system ATP-binding protein